MFLVTATYTLPTAAMTVLADATTGAFAINLPNAALYVVEYEIKAITAGANLVTLTPIAGQMIDGAATVSLGSAASTASYNAVTIRSDGMTTTWRIM